MTESERVPGRQLPLGIAEVTGPSMVPTLNPGDQVLVHYGAPVKAGDVVLLRHPLQQDLIIVKRLVERRDAGWWVLADNEFVEGDSRLYGAVPEELLIGRVRARYRPRGTDRRSACATVSWLVSALRPVLTERSVSRRLRAR